MNQLQTVLDALERIDAIERGMVTTKAHHYAAREETTEAIAIVRQMMQAEPVAFLDKYGNVFSEVEKLLPTDTPLYTAPQATPQAASEWLPISSVPKYKRNMGTEA